MNKRKAKPAKKSEVCMTPWDWNDGACGDCKEWKDCTLHSDQKERKQHLKEEKEVK